MSEKPKCPVFGCTIPRGIAHSHPAGVSAVMRDPVEPLNSFERMELELYRKQNKIAVEAAKSLADFNAAYPPMVPGRKLRYALLMAAQIKCEPTFEDAKPDLENRFDWCGIKIVEATDPSEALLTKIAFWMIVCFSCAVGLALSLLAWW